MEFNMLTSGFDFFVCMILRYTFIFTGLILVASKLPTDLFFLVFTSYGVCSISFSLVKLLCFSEWPDQLYFIGMWISIFWNILGSIFSAAAFHFLIKKRMFKPNYERMEEEEEQASDDGEPGTSNAQEKPEKVTRKSVMSHVKFLLRYALLYWKWFTVACVFLVIYSTARIFIPFYTGKVIASIVYQDEASKKHFYSLVLTMTGFMVVSTICAGFRGASFCWGGALVNRTMRRDLFNSLIRQEIAFFDKLQTGAILSRLTTDCQTVTSILELNINVFMRNTVMLIGSLVFMLSLSWRLTVVTFIVIPPVGVFTKLYGQYYDKLSEGVQTTLAEANRTAEECLGTIRTVRAFACEHKESNRFEDKLVETLAIMKKKTVAYMGYAWLNELSENVVLIAVLVYAGHLAMNGLLTIEQITSFLLYQLQLGETFYSLNYVFSGLMESVGASRKVFEYMHKDPEIPYDGTVEKPVEGQIKFENVNFAYPTRPNSEVLKGLNLSINPGETVALVGPSGAGKSSIIALLEYFYEIGGGKITLDGVNIRDYAHKYYHQQVSLVSQEPTLYSGSIRYNILYGCEEWATDTDMIEAAKLANAHDFISELDEGYDTKCGEKGVQMSGGQKQRIAIARALVRKPAVLILDEATSALDAESEYIIQKALNQCSVGRTVIVIAHRLSTVEKADRIFVIKKGQVIQEGNHQSLMEVEGMYRQLVKRQLLNGESSKDDSGVEEVDSPISMKQAPGMTGMLKDVEQVNELDLQESQA
ncbi:unnamed protein product [Bursaphelenchus okinawaensis]|uniref:Uncharacterized protein n=1 Tax=Bursaphelenchus okinawaensis TaxID=465554 RepID=A0A811K2I6_9BILA|nr:unnamed protein product [Bursaphelenchus okinawaensis]CAG9090565.1 unnamed protein product [Bursaphelenchus okinawaensis]